METIFKCINRVVKSKDRKIQDLRQDVNNHDGLLKAHENIIRGKNSSVEENSGDHFDMGNEFPSV